MGGREDERLSSSHLRHLARVEVGRHRRREETMRIGADQLKAGRSEPISESISPRSALGEGESMGERASAGSREEESREREQSSWGSSRGRNRWVSRTRPQGRTRRNVLIYSPQLPSSDRNRFFRENTTTNAMAPSSVRI